MVGEEEELVHHRRQQPRRFQQPLGTLSSRATLMMEVCVDFLNQQMTSLTGLLDQEVHLRSGLGQVQMPLEMENMYISKRLLQEYQGTMLSL